MISPGPIHNPGDLPTSPITWPADQHQSNQIQQTKGNAKAQSSFAHATTQPSVPTVASRTTPPTVSGVRVVLRDAGAQKQVTVQFNHPSGSPYFTGANVYLRQAGKQPVLVAGGAKSPVTFTATKNNAPHSVYITSVSNWGETDVLSSPAHPVRLL